MKKMLVILWVIMGFVLASCTKQETAKQPIELVMDCVGCSDSDGEYWLTIIANREEITDKEVFSQELIEMVRNNEFKKIMFSYDVNGYPIELQMNVYLTRADWQDKEKEPYMQISFEQENILNGYNIVEHYDKFQMNIK